MSKGLLKDFVNTVKFMVIDDWTKKHIETLPADEAIAKYGECEVMASYTSGGFYPNFETDVWVKIPGMHLADRNNRKVTLPGTSDEAEFIGKKSGMLITVTKLSPDDYQIWWHESENDGETDGYSVVGSMLQIMDELKDEI